MPIKEFIALAVSLCAGLAVAHPLNFQTTLRKIQASILRMAARTDNWGNPSIFPKSRKPESKGAGPAHQAEPVRRSRSSSHSAQ